MKCTYYTNVFGLRVFFMQNKKINWVGVFFLCVYPVLLLIGLALYIYFYGATGTDIVLAMVAYYGANISVGLGYHRLWSHNAYKTNKFIEIILAFLTAGTFQGPVLAWASDHRRHHAYTDKEGDPHSPSKYESKWKGFWWSHIGWMLVGTPSYENLDPTTMKRLGGNKILTWQFDNYMLIAFYMNAILPMGIGFAVGGTLQAALASCLFMGAGRFLQQQMTFCVNSLCHLVGSRKYYNGTARDVWWLFVFLLGENYHNYHHAFAQDYRNGIKWYHADVHKWLIALMEKCGLAWGLVRTSQERIAMKVQGTSDDNVTNLQKVQQYSIILAEALHEKVKSFESSTDTLKCDIKNRVYKLEISALKLAKKTDKWINHYQSKHNKLSRKAVKKFYKLQKQIIDADMHSLIEKHLQKTAFTH